MSNPADACHILKEGLASNIGRVGFYLALDNGTQVRKTDVTDPYSSLDQRSAFYAGNPMNPLLTNPRPYILKIPY